MFNALRESIIPYFIIEENKTNIPITIDRNFLDKDSHLSSTKIAKNLGFKRVKKSKINYELKYSDFNFHESNLKIEKIGISSERLEELRKEVFRTHIMLSKVSDELKMAYGFDSELAKVSEVVKDYIYKIQDDFLPQN